MRRRYPALRALSTVFKVLAVLAFLAGLVMGIMGTLQGLTDRAVVIIGVGVIYAVFLWAGAELILVVLDIEENTRRMAESLPEKSKEGE